MRDRIRILVLRREPMGSMTEGTVGREVASVPVLRVRAMEAG